MQHHFCDIDGVNIHYVQDQPEHVDDNTETLVFLHGFPECWQSWSQQLQDFAGQYRVIAPDLVGYNESDKPSDSHYYKIPNLVSVFSRFMGKISATKPVYLIAHDWGGAIAWNLAAFHQHLFKGLIIINAAHPSTFTREMFTNVQQREKSDYIHQLVSDSAQQTLSQDNFAFLRAMLRDSQGNSVLEQSVLADYCIAWRKAGAIKAMLEYYRQMPQLVPRGAGDVPKHFTIPNIRVAIPTLVLWGEQDNAFVPQLLDELDEYVVQLQVVRFAKASHWLHHEYPQQVNAAIRQFIANQRHAAEQV